MTKLLCTDPQRTHKQANTPTHKQTHPHTSTHMDRSQEAMSRAERVLDYPQMSSDMQSSPRGSNSGWGGGLEANAGVRASEWKIASSSARELESELPSLSDTPPPRLVTPRPPVGVCVSVCLCVCVSVCPHLIYALTYLGIPRSSTYLWAYLSIGSRWCLPAGSPAALSGSSL